MELFNTATGISRYMVKDNKPKHANPLTQRPSITTY